MSGLTDSGFEARRVNEILSIIQSELESRLGQDLDFARDTVLGQLVAVVAEQMGSLEEALQAVYDARSLNNATGIQLDVIGSVNGVERDPATSTVVTCLLTSDATLDQDNRFVPPDTLFADDDGQVFELGVDTVLGTVFEQTGISGSGTVFLSFTDELRTAGDREIFYTEIDYDASDTNESVAAAFAEVFQTRSGGTDTRLSDDIADYQLTAHGPYLYFRARRQPAQVRIQGFSPDSDPQQAIVQLTAQQEGRVVPSGTVSQILQPAGGVRTVEEFEDLRAIGEDIEPDSDYRARIANAQQSQGATSTNALRGAILDDVEAVQDCVVLENDQMTAQTIEGVSVNAKAYTPIVYPSGLDEPTQREILEILYERAAIGIEADASDVTGTVADDSSKVVAYDYATEQEIQIEAEVTLDAETQIYEVREEYEAQIRATLEGLTIGEVLRELRIVALASEIDGILAVTYEVQDSGGATLVTDADYDPGDFSTILVEHDPPNGVTVQEAP